MNIFANRVYRIWGVKSAKITPYDFSNINFSEKALEFS